MIKKTFLVLSGAMLLAPLVAQFGAVNELCAFIPGAPCGNVGVRALNGEGFVRISEGIHGVGSLPANVWDWRNPVAKITIRRINSNEH